MFNNLPEHVFKKDDDTEDHGGGTDDGRTDEHRFCRCLEGVAGTVGLFKIILGGVEIRLEPEFALNFCLYVGHLSILESS